MAKQKWGSGAMTAPQVKASEPADFPTVSAADAQREIDLTNGSSKIEPAACEGVIVIGSVSTTEANSHTVSRKPRDPNAPRNKYVVMGVSKTDGVEAIIYNARSLRDANRWIDSVKMMLRMCFVKVAVVRSKTMSTMEF